MATDLQIRGVFNEPQVPSSPIKGFQDFPSNPAGVLASIEAERESATVLPTQGEAQVWPFPYATLIRSYLERDQVSAARSLLEIALRQQHREPSLSALQRVLAPPKVSASGKKDVDRSPEYQWLATQGPAYRGKWVAVSGNELVGHAGSLKELLALLATRELARAPLVCRIDE